MKKLLPEWRKYLKEEASKIYYWQTQGPWLHPEDPIGQHVPKARPRQEDGGRIEDIFEAVRKEKFPDRPSRLDCVYLCENVKGWEGRSYCRYPASDGGETYEVELRGDYNLFKANAEFWVAALERVDNESETRSFAESYWKGAGKSVTFLEILVSPPEAAVIVGRYEE
tara:strand:- start:191 stop:694 length:504 start_codon:yes stop_codon:yes gene_type:complete